MECTITSPVYLWACGIANPGLRASKVIVVWASTLMGRGAPVSPHKPEGMSMAIIVALFEKLFMWVTISCKKGVRSLLSPIPMRASTIITGDEKPRGMNVGWSAGMNAMGT